ncbi:MAG: 16S rRNA (guanine(966)-N(2))-methyltransferase RsmD [Clostridiales bacterium]|nr:16S rRNA (guanine(966)-N(2))-methyltransferase RsmD [Clostridiales bacterium]
MRIITGTARGRRLTTLEGQDVRPTSDRVKEALFSILHFELEGRRFLDLFAGSGQIGLEALSRGAGSCVFVDASRDSVAVVRENLNRTGLQTNAQVVNMDYAAYLRSNTGTFDLAFLDPPYYQGHIAQALETLPEKMNQGGVIVCEHPSDETVPEQAGRFTRRRDYRYGKIIITTYREEECP